MALVAKRVSEQEVFNSRSSLGDILEALKSEPGQWLEFEVSNGAVGTAIKRHKGFDARTRKVVDADGVPTGVVRLQACYVGPDFQATFIPRVRKAKANTEAAQ